MKITYKKIKDIADKIGVNIKHISLEQIKKGLEDEWEEHGPDAGKLAVIDTTEDAEKTALAHLTKIDPKYYDKTEQMFGEYHKKFKDESANGKLEEFTVYDWKGKLSPIIKRTAAKRSEIKGNFERGIQLTDFDVGTGIAEFAVEPTYKFSNIELDAKGRDKGMTNLYTCEIQLLDYENWIDNWETVTLDEFKDFLKVCEVKLNCTCKFYHWGGVKYQLTQLDSAINPTNIPDHYWRTKHTEEGVPTLCKHLNKVLIKFIRYPQQLLKDIQRKV